MPGTITINGIIILGKAAINGVRRAADIDSAAMARCTTRKTVHQYPNESTNPSPATRPNTSRSEEHTSELQSPCNLVCRLLLEKKKNDHKTTQAVHTELSQCNDA